MLLARHPAYHGRSRGNVQQVNLRFVAREPARALQMYEADDLDICGDLPPSETDLARQRQAGDYVAGPCLSLEFVGFDVSRPPFDDRRVRRALALATDRDRLADVVLGGYAFPATGGLLPPDMPGHAPGIGLPYDPATARQLLAEAGLPGGRGFPAIDCWVRDDPGHELLCEYLAAHWSETLGLQIAWQRIEWGRFYDRVSSEPPHLWLVGWWFDYPDPDNFLRSQWWSSLKWRDETHERLVKSARRVQDQQERIGMYQQAERILVESAPVIPLLYGRFHLLVKPWMSKYPSSPLKWWFWKDVVLEPH
jgi:ABC-type transport system substrate-binding protein